MPNFSRHCSQIRLHKWTKHLFQSKLKEAALLTIASKRHSPMVLSNNAIQNSILSSLSSSLTYLSSAATEQHRIHQLIRQIEERKMDFYSKKFFISFEHQLTYLQLSRELCRWTEHSSNSTRQLII